MTRAIIIGAGMGGLSAALRLGHQGFKVTVLEKQARPGGRSNVIEEQGFRADTGPTILVMKSAFDDTYRAIGQDLDQRIKFVRLDPNYRVYFHDDTHLDLFSDTAELSAEVEKIQPGAAANLTRFITDSARKYELGMDFVDRNYDRITDLANPTALVRLIRTRSYQNLYREVDRYFHNDKLNKAFSFHSMFLGLSPFDALAMYTLITYADLALGMWYPRGGIYRLVEDMVQLATEMGVEIRTGSPVERLLISNNRVTGVELENGEVFEADLVISNADLPYTYHHLINGHSKKDYSDSRLDRMDFACSGYILFLGINRTYDHLRHQSLYFSQDYRANLDSIYKTRSLPEDPSFHINIPTLTDPGLAPPGHSLIYLLAPMPNLSSGIDWEKASPIVREQMIRQLERLVDPEIRKHIVWEREYNPTDWQRDINAELGTAFGSIAHGFFQSSYFRPHNKDHNIQGLYFVGQGTYPGIGMPMVHISAKLVTERILREWN